MLDAARWIWTAALAGCLAAMLTTGRWRRLPVFCVWLVATAAQTVAHWSNIDMDGTWWIRWTLALTALRAAAVVECVWLRMSPMETRAGWVISIAAISAGATYGAGRVRPDAPWLQAAQVLRHFQAGLLAFLLLGMLAARLWGCRTSGLRRHSWILALYIGCDVAGLLAYEVMEPGAWWSIMTAGYLNAAACYLCWTLAAWSARRSAHLVCQHPA